MLKAFFKKNRKYIVVSVGMVFVLGCTQAGLNLIKQLEARELKSEAIKRREMCFNDFVNEERFKECYEREVAQLVAEECKTIRQTEPVLQKDCEDFLYRIVMKPDSIFPGMSEGEEFPSKFRKDSLHPTEREGGCDRDSACRSKCQDIFNTGSTRRECYAYSVSAVNSMKDAFEKLDSPTTNNLNSLVSATRLRYLRILLNISITETLGSLTARSDEQDKMVYNWIARNKAVADTFYKAELYKETFYALHHFFGNSSSAVVDNLNTSLTDSADGDNIIDIMLENENEMGLKWIHDLLKNVNTNDDRNTFIDYCRIMFHDQNERRYFNYSFFTDLLDVVLQDNTPSSLPSGNPPDWWTADTISQDIDPDQWWDSDTTDYSTDGNVCELI